MATGNAKKDQNFTSTLIGVSSADGVTPVRVEVDPSTGAVLTSSSVGGTLVTEAFDYIAATQPNATTEVYAYKTGGAAGTTVATVTVVYVDSTKADLSTVTRT
jgi:hypothetical protein